MRHLLRVPLTLADHAVALARDVALGVLFSRGPALVRTAVKRLCLEISHKGKGTVGVSTYLSPNALLLLGQEDTLDRFKSAMRDVLPAQTQLRKTLGAGHRSTPPSPGNGPYPTARPSFWRRYRAAFVPPRSRCLPESRARPATTISTAENSSTAGPITPSACGT
jgi:hypothetical protein